MPTAHCFIPILAIILPGCGTSTPRDPDRPYYGRDRYLPSPAQDIYRSLYGAGFDPYDR